jgi:hypothetical protein
MASSSGRISGRDCASWIQMSMDIKKKEFLGNCYQETPWEPSRVNYLIVENTNERANCNR